MIKRFYTTIIIQILLIAATTAAFFWAAQKSHLLVTSINLFIIWVLQIIYLVWYINKINRELARFFEAFKYHDSMITFNTNNENKAFNELYTAFNRIIADYSQIRKEREKEQFFYLNAIHHVNIGLIAFDESGEVMLCNKSFDRIFRKGAIKHIIKLDSLRQGLTDIVKNMKPNQKEFIRVYVNEEIIHLSLRCGEIKIDDHTVKLISFQDIKYEIEQDEVDAWQRLIRTLNHEIMNSVSPITLTTSGILNLFEKEDKARPVSDINEETIENTIIGLHAIRKRSKGLAKFVESYRSITQIPQPTFVNFKVDELFKSIEAILKEELAQQNISLQLTTHQTGMQLLADEKLIEQVLINLISNSAQALKGIVQASISLNAWHYNDSVYISVTDNGKGIPVDNIENIFIPFFTTKPEGSGIGLSLSRQIMRLHSGNISVRSVPSVETVFTLKF